ncbi:hypothetical protein CDD83_10378 [Cordyceps sp. RAO-2017]|nr:hypothetical protein CDD83_10378 [Cordyceps sp. RAO-2017]
MSSVPNELAATVQVGHIRTDPDPTLDITPSTAAEKKQPVTVESSQFSQIEGTIHDELDGVDGGGDEDEDDIPYSTFALSRAISIAYPRPTLGGRCC